MRLSFSTRGWMTTPWPDLLERAELTAKDRKFLRETEKNSPEEG